MADKNRKAFTMVEVLVCTGLIALMLGFVWFFYFDSRETTRHTVTQSKIQSEIRNMLDRLELEMISCYAFITVDTEKKSFSFYSFTPTPPHLDDVFYDTSGNYITPGTDSTSKIAVGKFEYSCGEDGKIIRKVTPGFLYFQKSPMVFEEGTETDPRYAKSEKVSVNDVADFEVRPYTQKVTYNADGSCTSVPELVTGTDMTKTSFITLRIHAKIDESAKRRDEEVDLVTKFYSSFRLAENANPGYFCSTDSDGRY